MWLVAWISPGIGTGLTYRLTVGLFLAIAGLVIALAGILAFQRVQTTINPTRPDSASSLVTTGIFRHSRNPMYLAMLLALLGWGVILGNLWSLAILPLFVAYMTRFQILPEERAMTEVFGSEFDEYRQKVRRWI
jgi:protein-S-isoprenylcysteine O-methyltransferase Ste14